MKTGPNAAYNQLPVARGSVVAITSLHGKEVSTNECRIHIQTKDSRFCMPLVSIRRW